MANHINSETLTATQQFNCKNCGNALSVINPRAKYISCQYCGAVSDASSEEHQVLMSMAPPQQHKPFSFIKVGMIATFFDKKYQVISRTRWQQDYFEYWSEEGETGYSRELWVYDEWLMISEQRTYFYLIEDKDGYFISNEFIPSAPSLPDEHSRSWTLNTNAGKAIIQEYGSAKVIYFEGESNYQIKTDDIVQFAMYRRGLTEFSAEWRMSKDNETIKEIEFFKESPIKRRDVMVAFEANAELDQLRSKGHFWEWLMYSAAGLAIFCGVMLFMGITHQEKTMFTQQFSLFDMYEDVTESGEQNFIIPEENNPTNPSDTTANGVKKSITSDPIIIEEKGLYKIKLSTIFDGTNEEVFVVAYFSDASGEIINYFDKTFGVYSGYDDEGYWSEQELSTKKYVVVKEPGTYYATVLAKSNTNPRGNATISIYKDILYRKYYIIGLIASIIVALIFRYITKTYLG